MILIAVAAIAFWLMLPKKLFTDPVCYVIGDSEGNLLSASIAADGQWRFPYNNEVPQKFIDCIITFEDKRFFIHPGVDFIAFGRAAFANSKNRQVQQGWSTITKKKIGIC